MNFKEKYTITERYLTSGSKRRSGQLIFPAVKFIVAHDTGNSNSTASGNVNHFENSRDKKEASAHIFVDDKAIIECIPALTSDKPEKAWHVLYDKPKDNELYGDDANDVAIGVEYCFGNDINANESYNRYIWVLAYICYKFNLDPRVSIVGHHILDPERKIDPKSGLSHSGRTYEQLLKDVVTEYHSCLNNDEQRLNNKLVHKQNHMMKLIQNSKSNKVYVVGNDNKKHWIFNMEALKVGNEMGLWGDKSCIEVQDDDPFEEGHSILLVH